MTWDEIASKHIDHRCILRDAKTLQCVDCGHKLLLPREPKAVAVTGPPPYRRTDLSQAATPEQIARARRRAEAEIEHRKRLKQNAETEEHNA